MTWLLAHPLPPSPVSKLSLFLGLPVCRRSSLLTGEGERVGEEPNHTTARKPGPLEIIHYSLLLPLCLMIPDSGLSTFRDLLLSVMTTRNLALKIRLDPLLSIHDSCLMTLYMYLCHDSLSLYYDSASPNCNTIPRDSTVQFCNLIF
jgi:hypothetical protein